MGAALCCGAGQVLPCHMESCRSSQPSTRAGSRTPWCLWKEETVTVPTVHDLPYFCPQLMVQPTHSAPAQTFPVLPAQNWSRLHHHTPTGKSIAGKRAQEQHGLKAPARQQKVGRICLGGSSAGSECPAHRGPAVLSGCLGLECFLCGAQC